MKKLNVLDLFCGAGGLTRGFMDAGYNVVLGVDFDEAALKTFKANHGNADTLKIDLFNYDNISDIEDFINVRNIEIDFLEGGRPCQGFSLAGARDKKDERNSLYTAMVKIGKKLKPKAVILENVPGLLTLYNGKAPKEL